MLSVELCAKTCRRICTTLGRKKSYRKSVQVAKRLRVKQISSGSRSNRIGISIDIALISVQMFQRTEFAVIWSDNTVKCLAVIYLMVLNFSWLECCKVKRLNLPRSWPMMIRHISSRFDLPESFQWTNPNRFKSWTWFSVVPWMAFIWRRLDETNLIQTLRHVSLSPFPLFPIYLCRLICKYFILNNQNCDLFCVFQSIGSSTSFATWNLAGIHHIYPATRRRYLSLCWNLTQNHAKWNHLQHHQKHSHWTSWLQRQSGGDFTRCNRAYTVQQQDVSNRWDYVRCISNEDVQDARWGNHLRWLLQSESLRCSSIQWNDQSPIVKLIYQISSYTCLPLCSTE